MFSLFKKKENLSYLLKDHVDIHNHLLPGIDDGAANVEESIRLIKQFQELGVNEFIATPHIMNDYYPNTPKTVMAAFSLLQEELQKNNRNEVRIKAAAEYMMDQSFIDLMEQGDLLTLKENLVLVEMSYFQPPINLNEILFQMQTKGYKPILAHPERYVFYHSKELEKYKELKTRGCKFQLNLLSVTGHYGSNIKDMAFKLLDEDLIDYLGSDTHQQRHLDRVLESKLSEKKMEQLRPIVERTAATFRSAIS